jgi:trehalose/maltose hydrolase-like predicted phosphorylase
MTYTRLWNIKEYPFIPEKLRHYETIFSIGNGYLSTRGSFEERYEGDTPTTLIHGIFDHAPEMSVPELVNVPNWTDVRLTVDGTPFSLNTRNSHDLKPSQGAVLGYERLLLMNIGLLRRTVLFRAASGATVRVVFERFASLADEHILAQRIHITAIDGTPEITLEAALDGDVTNNGIRHWSVMQSDAGDNRIGLYGVTGQSHYELGMTALLAASEPAAITTQTNGTRPTASVTHQLAKDGEITFDKLTAVYTSRDTSDVRTAARAKAAEAAAIGYDTLLNQHRARWAAYWDAADIEIDGDDAAQVALRFCTYHVLIASPQHDDDVSIGAKTLSGLGYKGHVFWDTELFMLPVLTLTMPAMARNMLMYRYKRLAGARAKAQGYGLQGALFPWESTDTGVETTPQWSDPFPDGKRLRIWTGDNEQHINTDITYAILQYWQWTGDDQFLLDYGAEMVLDTAVFWGSRVEERNGRYELTQQIGPDEYHENIDNSVFTNRMVQWHLQQALKLLDWLNTHAPKDAARLMQQLDLSPARLDHWRDVIARMFIPFDTDRQIHIQFEGFFDLEYIPVPKYEPRVGGLWGVLGHERALQSQMIKQADVVMLIALLGDEVGSREVMLNNWNTYFPRCDHGSSLSPAIHAWVAARLGLIDEATHLFEHAAFIDLEDNKGNVADGIHGAACGGLWQAVVRGFCGLHIAPDGTVQIAPQLPPHWKRVRFNVTYRGQKYPFVITNPV